MAGDEAVLEFLEVVRRLRAECPWKAAQSHRSLARYLLEETHEALEALDTGDGALLREELGDLLLQVFLHAAIAEQAGEFTMADVARDITEKMYRRNPHVFGDVDAAGLDPAQVNEVWEARKAEEKRRTSPTDGVPPGLPALAYADKVLDRLRRAGTAELPRAVRHNVAAEPGTRGVGERLLDLVVEARAEGLDPEQELRDAVRGLL